MLAVLIVALVVVRVIEAWPLVAASWTTYSVLTTPVQHIETIEVLSEGPDLYPAQVAEIRRARHSVHLEAYIFHPGDRPLPPARVWLLDRLRDAGRL